MAWSGVSDYSVECIYVIKVQPVFADGLGMIKIQITDLEQQFVLS